MFIANLQTVCLLLQHHLSGDLSWTNHILYVTTKAYKIRGLLRRSYRNCISVHSKKLLYISLVRSQLIYGSQVWHPCLLNNIDALETVQRRSTKFILNDYTLDYKSRLLALTSTITSNDALQTK